MKKLLLAVFVLGAVILVSGCFKKTGTEQKPGEQKGETGGIINSIRDAVGLGKKMQCTYTYKDGENSFTSTAFIEGKKYRGESEVMGKKNITVFDGETMYNWSPDDKKGTKFSKSCMDELNKESQEDKSEGVAGPTEDDMKDAAEAFKDAMDVKCTDVSSIDFSVPSDINFSDMCEQLKKIQDMTKNLPQGANMPKGVDVPDNYSL